MYITNHIVKKIIPTIFLTNILCANISGTVFQDLPLRNDNNVLKLNQYGHKDANELGVKNIKITAYPENISTVTDANGAWILNVTQDSRLEFSDIPSYLQESINAEVKNSSVQFIKNNNHNVLLGLHNPSDYTSTVNPPYVTNIQQNGTHVNSTIQNLQTVSYSATELNANFKTSLGVQGTGEIPQDIILMNEIGSVWGKAYQKNKKRLFIASMLQRHMGFSNTEASIYITDYSNYLTNQYPVLVGDFSLQGRAPANGGSNIDLGTVDRSVNDPDLALSTLATQPNIDFDAYSKVGKISYGGIDIDHNTNTLWLMNLNQRALISLDIKGDLNSLNSAQVNQYMLPNLANCVGGEFRPWALKIHNNRGYIGAVCDASVSKSSNDLSAHIYSFDLNNPGNGFNNELTFPLNYPRQISNWHAWEDNYIDPTNPAVIFNNIYEQAILSDIEFDEHNNMYISFFDRYSTQISADNYKAIKGSTELEGSYEYGELLKICNNNGTYEKEGDGSCLASNYNHLNIPEFFNDRGGDGNYESSMGALALLKGSSQLLNTTLDPHPEGVAKNKDPIYFFTQGTNTYSTINGSIENWYANAYTLGNGLGTKGNGIGDIEFITDAAPLEIGDRIWFDINNNGLQDANEAGISGVNINLICQGNTYTATTDTDGYYIFSNDPQPTSNGSHIYGVQDLVENNKNNCLLSIPNTSGSNQQTVLNTYTITTSNVNQNTNNNIDNDGIQNTNKAIIPMAQGDIKFAGHNNHSFDIGFTQKAIVNPSTPYSITNTVWEDSNHNGIQDSNEVSGIANITVNLYANPTCTGDVNQTTTTDVNGNYQLNNIAAGTYCLEFLNIPSDYNITLQNIGTDDSKDSDANPDINANDYAQVQNLVINANNSETTIGLFNPSLLNQATVQIGNRVWIENDNDGNALTGIVTPFAGIVVIATATNGTQYSSVTDIHGNYLITVPLNDTYIVSLTTSNNYLPTNNSDDNNISDTTSENDLSHDSTGTSVSITDIDNLTVDFGFRLINILGTTTCQDMTINDDVQHANPTNAITVIDVLANDTGSKIGQSIKFLPLNEGKTFWENQNTTITSATTLNALLVPGEGTWTIENNEVVFTALTSFDGQIPTPIYYIIEGSTDCTTNTRYTNVGKITIDTACTCPPYSTKSVSTLNLFHILILVLLTLIIGVKQEKYKR